MSGTVDGAVLIDGRGLRRDAGVPAEDRRIEIRKLLDKRAHRGVLILHSHVGGGLSVHFHWNDEVHLVRLCIKNGRRDAIEEYLHAAQQFRRLALRAGLVGHTLGGAGAHAHERYYFACSYHHVPLGECRGV